MRAPGVCWTFTVCLTVPQLPPRHLPLPVPVPSLAAHTPSTAVGHSWEDQLLQADEQITNPVLYREA